MPAWRSAGPVPAWVPLDSVTVAKLLAFGLSFDVDVGFTTTLTQYQSAGAANGFVQYFSGTGQRQWSCFLAAAVVGIAPQESGGCLVALHSGAVVGLDRVGRVVHTATSGAAITAATGAAGGLLVGRTDGSVEWYGSV